MKGVIYKYTSPSGKVYIGLTYKELKRRSTFLNLNCKYGGKAINNARLKYLPENFKYEVLVTIEADTKLELCSILNQLEQKYVEQFKSNNSKYGYNETVGGQNAANYGMLGKHHSEETKLKIAEINRNNPETIDRCRLNGMKTAITIDVFTKDGTFIETIESISEAARKYNASKANIAKNVAEHPKYKSVKGYVFKKSMK